MAVRLIFLHLVKRAGAQWETLLLKTNPRKVSDGGGQFRSNQAMDVYTALGIRKEQIEKRQAWQNYIESKSDPTSDKTAWSVPCTS